MSRLSWFGAHSIRIKESIELANGSNSHPQCLLCLLLASFLHSSSLNYKRISSASSPSSLYSHSFTFSTFIFIFLSVIISSPTTKIDAKPLSHSRISSSTSSSSSDTFAFSVDFLLRYGYLHLPKSHPSNGAALRSEDRVREAIFQMQKFGNLKQTGIIDNETLVLMNSKRCGVEDVVENGLHERVKRYALQGSKWMKTDLTWSVNHWAQNMDHHYILNELRKAFKVWAEASVLTFTETRRADADIVISFLKGRHGDEYPFDGPGSILAHAFFPGNGIGGDAHFDADEVWSKKGNTVLSEDDDGVSLFAVAAHEFGHSLGLSHSPVPGSLMFPYYQSIKEGYVLPHDDSLGIQQLYGAKATNKYPSMPPFATTKHPYMTPKYPSANPPKASTPLNPKSRRPAYWHPNMPDACNTSIDAIASIRRDIFIFKGKYFWWIKENRTITRPDPIEVDHYFIGLPKNIEKIDAVYERPSDKKIVFFIGRTYWLFSDNRIEQGYPRSLTDIGLPQTLERIDAAMIWGHNGKTYLFSGNQYWRYEEEEGRVELDYPRDISVWKGLPNNIDAAFQWTKDGQTYFFHDKNFWLFNNRRMSVDDYPQSISHFWFQSLCPNAHQYPLSDGRESNHSYSIFDSKNKLFATNLLIGIYLHLTLFLFTKIYC